MVSSKDVAKHAGVSQTTVSRVLNTPELVKKSTLEKVMKSIEKLGYVPNDIARSLVQNKTGVVTLVSGPLHNPFFVDTTTAIVNYANKNGYKINVYFGTEDNLNTIYTSVLETRTDAIILSSILYDDPLYEKLEKLKVPFIMFNRKHKNNNYYVEIDNEQAGRLVAEHINSLGHKKLCWIGGPQTMSTFYGRQKGFYESLKNLGYDVNSIPVYNTDTTKSEIRSAFEQILSLEFRPSAICAATDAIAIEILNICLEYGFRVPEDFNIIGIDNVEQSKHRAINLTTIGIEKEKNLGQLAVMELFKILNNENACIRRTESVKLFLRNTTSNKID